MATIEVEIAALDVTKQLQLCKARAIGHILQKLNPDDGTRPDYRALKELRILLDTLNAVTS